MKKYLCASLALLFVLLCSCGGDKSVIKKFDEESGLPAHITRLYPEKSGDTKVAVLLRRYDDTASAVATADAPDGELKTVYELPAGSFTYEIAAGGGVIAFYELTAYTDGSVKYALKVIDTENGNKVHSPFKKTVSQDGGVQTRFIAVCGGAVFYLTRAELLERCRVMKYDVSTGELTEFLAFPFTDNELTGGSSCTFISEKRGYLTCGVVDGKKTTLKTYDAASGALVKEKPLPYGAAMVCMADFDYDTGMYAMYYLSAQNDERVAVFAFSDEEPTDILSLDEGTYIDHDEVRIVNDRIYFELQDTGKTGNSELFKGVCANALNGEAEYYDGVYDMLLTDGGLYTLEFDNETDYTGITMKIRKGA